MRQIMTLGVYIVLKCKFLRMYGYYVRIDQGAFIKTSRTLDE